MKIKELLQENPEHKYLTNPDEVKAWLAKAMGEENGKYAYGAMFDVYKDGSVSFKARTFVVTFTFNEPYLPIKIEYASSLTIINPNLKSFKGLPEEIDGNFICTGTKIETLEGCPKTIWGDFNISVSKNLKSLKGGPTDVRGDYICTSSGLTSLEGAPQTYLAGFRCSGNKKLKSLEHGPRSVSEFECSHCDLRSLKGAPRDVTYFNCIQNKNLNSLEGCPKSIQQHFFADECGIFSLVGIEKLIDEAEALSFGSVSEGGLGLIYIKGLNSVTFNTPNGDSTPCDIIQEFTERPEDLYECQAELIENGFEEYAKL